nr:DUF6443 domain-containing protein [Pedobacter sp. ASV2]
MKRYLNYSSVLLLLLSGFGLKAQDHKTVSTYNGEAEITAPLSVTLTDGFHATGNVRIYTTGKSLQNCFPLVSLPSSNQNYILTRIFKQRGVTEATLGNARLVCDENQTIQYFDGLGRPLQTVTVQGSPTGKDLVQPVVYDAFGREQFKYLPYAASTGSNGSYRADALTGQSSFYLSQPATSGIPVISTPFSQTVFEASPLNRVLEQGAPGLDWQPAPNSLAGHTVKMDYGTNALNEVKLWTINAADNGASAGVYLPGKLYKTISKDENWKPADDKMGTVEEFKDFEGHVVLKRTWETNSKSLSTYYVYDDYGNLRYVLPPAVNENGQSPVSSFTESDTSFNNFIYGYHYDGRKRLVEKKIPGKGWEYMVYNPLDQVVFSQDAVQAAKSPKEWLFTKYDAFGRVILSGLYTGGGERLTLQASVDNQAASNQPLWEKRDNANSNGLNTGYTNQTLPTASISAYYSINYYDDYDFLANTFGQPNGVSQVNGGRTKGLPTGSRILTLSSSSQLLTVNYYDEEGRVVQSKSQNHLGGSDVVDNTYNFAGELTASTRTHIASGVTTTIANRYEYDHMGRKLGTFENINSKGEILLSKLDYNELGQLQQKNRHSVDGGNTFLQNTKFAYNERGWLKSSISDQFSIQLNYQDAINVTPQYNGNISNQLWGPGNNPAINTFSYNYDRLNRLTNASSPNLGEAISYDVMGNITSLSRDNFGTNNYTGYTGNQLTQISGFTNSSYTYNENGNLKSDSQKGINLTYNYLNLPTQVIGSQNITYTYNAAGQKLKKVSGINTTDYLAGIQYTNGAIEFIQTEEGVARRNGTDYSYEYNLTDHLGNVRATFYKNPNGQLAEVIQRDDYYAFGLRKMGIPNSNVNKYLYNGKELQEELGQYDYGARFYDPVIARWNVVDPLAEKFISFSPYNYVLDNPLKYIDPDGRDVELGIKKHRNGNVTEVQIKSKMNLTIVGSISESKLVALKERYARSFSGEFVTSVDNYKGKLETYKTRVLSELSITVVDKIDKAKSTDHIMVMSNNIAGEKESVQGLAKVGGTSSTVETGTLSTSGRFEKVASHEIGHNLGLDHKDASTSLMNEFVSGTYVTPNELKQIYGGAVISVPNNGKLIMYNDKDTRKDAKEFIKTNRVQ